MRKLVFITSIFAFLLLFSACEKDIKITGVPSPLIPISDLKEMYNGSPVTLKVEDMLGASFITGVVISDPVYGNAPDGLVILQDKKRNILRGIALEMGDAASNYNAGDSLVVKIVGKKLERKNGIMQITGVAANDVTRVGIAKTQLIHLTSQAFTDLFSNPSVYESTLVRLNSSVGNGTIFSETTTISDWADVMNLYTKPTALFADQNVPGFANFTGILFQNENNVPYLMMRTESDFETQILQPYLPKELYENFPEEWEVVVGTRKTAFTSAFETYQTGEWYMQNSRSLLSSNFVHHSGTYAVMTQGNSAAAVTMNFNLPYGASRFKFQTAEATATDNVYPMIVYAEYSQDSGTTWEQIGNPIEIRNNAKYIFDEELDIKGPVRFRIRKETSEKRILIDRIEVYQN